MSEEMAAGDGLEAAVAVAEGLLAAGDAVGAAGVLGPFAEAVESHEGLAVVWAGLLGAVGDAQVLGRQVRRLSAAWPRHPGVALLCAEAATRWVDPWPATGARNALAGLGAEVAARCIDGGGAVGRWWVPLHLALGRALARCGARQDDKALAAFEVGLAAAPEDARGWADLARFHQQRGRWRQGLGAAGVALGLAAGNGGAVGGGRVGGDGSAVRWDSGPARWTAAVCATALADAGAGAAWGAVQHLADGVDEGGRPRVAGLPAVEVVVWWDTPGEGSGELGAGAQRSGGAGGEAVWVEPISPCHGRIVSPTVLDLPADFDDVILWDPHPLSFRVVGGAETPRFGALAVLARGGMRTWRYRAEAAVDAGQVERGLPAGWRLYPFAGRVQGAAAVGGKVVVPRTVARAELVAALAGSGVELAG